MGTRSGVDVVKAVADDDVGALADRLHEARRTGRRITVEVVFPADSLDAVVTTRSYDGAELTRVDPIFVP
ncbi:MAG: hypothetical protein ACRD0G_20370 [Acidimicrobiales bacterium]